MADTHGAPADAHDARDAHPGDDAAHGAGHHAEAGDPPGPIDVSAWGALLLGIGLGLVTLAAFIQGLS